MGSSWSPEFVDDRSSDEVVLSSLSFSISFSLWAAISFSLSSRASESILLSASRPDWKTRDLASTSSGRFWRAWGKRSLTLQWFLQNQSHLHFTTDLFHVTHLSYLRRDSLEHFVLYGMYLPFQTLKSVLAPSPPTLIVSPLVVSSICNGVPWALWSSTLRWRDMTFSSRFSNPFSSWSTAVDDEQHGSMVTFPWVSKVRYCLNVELATQFCSWNLELTFPAHRPIVLNTWHPNLVHYAFMVWPVNMRVQWHERCLSSK